MRRLFSIVLMGMLLTIPLIAGALDVPYLTGRVTDNAQILSEPMRRSLSLQLKEHEERTGNQIAVLTVQSLGGESIENYAEEVFKAWKLGQKGKDNGILVIVAPKDRRMRIEVGYGLEGTLPDSVAGSIIRDVMTPKFKNEDYNGGVEAGVKAIITVLDGGKVPDAASKAKAASGFHMETPDMPLTERILIGAFIFGIIGLFTVIGILTPGMGWFLYVFLIPFWAMFPIAVVGTSATLYMLAIYVIGFPIAKLMLRKTEWYKKAGNDLRTKGQATIGGFTVTSGGSGSSWSSGSSDSSSSFSGGGGDSGGGGSSGSW